MAIASLEGRVLIVIGGTTGIGLSAAKAILDAGARGLVITGIDAASTDAALGQLDSRAVALTGDATEPSHAVRAIALASDRFGTLDGLYHVAGGSGRRWGDGPLHALSDPAIQETLTLNLASLIYSNRAAVLEFVAQRKGGAILNIGSVLGWSPSPAFFASHVYAAAKSAIIGFTKSAASYYATKNIRFNVLAPGLVDTPMAQRAAKDRRILEYIATKQPLAGGRIGHPSDCDGAAVFLLSDAARFVTGQVLAVDGGWTVSEGQIPV